MKRFFILWLIFLTQNLTAETPLKLIPEEYEVSGTSSIGMGFGGVAATSGINAVRTNPALMSSGKEYSAGAGYHWPTGGREFYQAGIVDSKTSSVAAGVNYTSFMNDYKTKGDQKFWFDSPVKKRFAIGVSYALPQVALGFGVQYVEGFVTNFEEDTNLATTKGWTIGGGGSGVIFGGIRVAASVENAANKKVQEFAPTIYRAGAAYPLTSEISINADYRNRQRVARFEADILSLSLTGDTQAPSPPNLTREQIGVASVNAVPHPNLRLSAGYAQSFSDKDFKQRKMMGAGAAIVGQKASLSYQLARPHAEESEDFLHSIQLNLEVAL